VLKKNKRMKVHADARGSKVPIDVLFIINELFLYDSKILVL